MSSNGTLTGDVICGRTTTVLTVPRVATKPHPVDSKAESGKWPEIQSHIIQQFREEFLTFGCVANALLSSNRLTQAYERS